MRPKPASPSARRKPTQLDRPSIDGHRGLRDAKFSPLRKPPLPVERSSEESPRYRLVSSDVCSPTGESRAISMPRGTPDVPDAGSLTVEHRIDQRTGFGMSTREVRGEADVSRLLRIRRSPLLRWGGKRVGKQVLAVSVEG